MVRPSFAYALAIASALPACGGDDDDGFRQCSAASDCEAQCQWLLADVGRTAPMRTFVRSWCDEQTFIPGGTGPTCNCVEEDGRSIQLSAAYSDPCLVFRRDRTCLYARDEFPGCDPGDATSCEAVCSDLQARMQADSMRTIDAEVRLASCHGYYCECLLRIEEGCYVDNELRRYDCALSDDEILAMSREPWQPPPCSVDMAADAGGGTCWDDSATSR